MPRYRVTTAETTVFEHVVEAENEDAALWMDWGVGTPTSRDADILSIELIDNPEK